MQFREAIIKWEDGLKFAQPETPDVPRKYFEQEVVFDNGTSVFYRRPVSECQPHEFEAWVQRLAKWLHCRINDEAPTRDMVLEHKQIWAKIHAAAEKEG